jgi:hypothetical protein
MGKRRCTSEERLLQPDPSDAETWADLAPQINEVSRAQQRSVLIEEPPRMKHGGVPINHLPEAECPQDAHAIGGQIDPGSNGWPLGAAFNELWGVALAVQGGGERQAGDAPANDQDAINVSHAVLLA